MPREKRTLSAVSGFSSLEDRDRAIICPLRYSSYPIICLPENEVAVVTESLRPNPE
jgi:hypothetical protein